MNWDETGCTMLTMLRCVASERTVFMLTLYFVCILYMRAACGERRPLELAWKTPPPTGLVWPEQPPVIGWGWCKRWAIFD